MKLFLLLFLCLFVSLISSLSVTSRWGPMNLHSSQVVVVDVLDIGDRVVMCGHFRGQLFPHHKSVPFLDLSLLSSEGNDRLFLVALSPLGNNTEKMEATHLWIAGGDGLSPTLTSDANVNCLGLTRDHRDGGIIIAGLHMISPQTPLQFTSHRGTSFSSFPPSSPGFFVSKLPFHELEEKGEGDRGEGGWRVEEVGLGGMEYIEWPETAKRCIVSPVALSSTPSYTSHIDSPSSFFLSQNTLHLSLRFTSCYSPSTPSYSSFESPTTASLQLKNNKSWTVVSEGSILLVGGEEGGGGFVRWVEGGVEVFVRGWGGGENLESYFADCGGRVGVGMTPQSIFLACQIKTFQEEAELRDIHIYKFKRHLLAGDKRKERGEEGEGELIKTVEGGTLKAVAPFILEKEKEGEIEGEGLRVVYLPNQPSPQYTVMDLTTPPPTTTPTTTPTSSKEAILTPEGVLDPISLVMGPIIREKIPNGDYSLKGSVYLRYVAEKYVTLLAEIVTISTTSEKEEASRHTHSSSSLTTPSSTTTTPTSSSSSSSFSSPQEMDSGNFYFIFVVVVVVCLGSLYGCNYFSSPKRPPARPFSP